MKKQIKPNEPITEAQLAQVEAEARRFEREAEAALQLVRTLFPGALNEPRVLELRAAVDRDRRDLDSPGLSPAARLQHIRADLERLRRELPAVVAEERQLEQSTTEARHPQAYSPEHPHPHLSPEEAHLFSKRAHRAHQVHAEAREQRRGFFHEEDDLSGAPDA